MENKALFTTALFFLIYFCNVQAVYYTNCGSEFEINEVTIETCPDDDYCYLPIGTSTLVSFTMNSGVKYDQINNLINDVSIYVRGTKFNVTVTPQNPCEVLSCPIRNNYSTVYAAEVYLSEEFPPIVGEFRWVMKTNSMVETLVCFSITVALGEEYL